jgi:hypothetical protein
MCLLYIDPGTGSMLFSIFIGLAAALYFLFRTLFIKIKFIFSGGKNRYFSKNRYSYVIYNEGIQYWNIFKPIIAEFEERKIPLHYLTSAEQDPFFKERYEYITGEFIGTGNKAFTKLNFLEADICLMTTPGLEVYQLKRSKGVRHYAHILHDTGDATCYRLFGIDWFDSVFLTGEYQIADIRELEKLRGTRQKKLPVVGSAYLDVYNEKIKDLAVNEERQFTILVSPSWGPGSLLHEFGEKLLDPLSATEWKVIIRPHPQSRKSEKEMLERLEEKYKDNPQFEWDYSPENITTLSKTDIMISDFSGIIFDFVFLFNKPVIYSNAFFNLEMYDASDLDHIPWRFEAVKKFAIELKKDDLEAISAIIQKARDDKIAAAARMDAKKTAWQYIGESGKRAVDYLVSEREKEKNA